MKGIIISSAQKAAAIITAVMMLMSCSSPLDEGLKFGNMPDRKPDSGRVPTVETRKVLLVYAAGYNSLSSYLVQNFNGIMKGWIPAQSRNDDVLLVYSHLTSSYGNYSTPSSPVLMQLYSDGDGNIVTDTLVTYPESTVSSSAATLNQVLSYVNTAFPAKSYGLLFSSHATGYLPAGFYSNPGQYIYKGNARKGHYGPEYAPLQFPDPQPVPYTEPYADPSLPAVRSIGQDRIGTSSFEMELQDFAEAIPMYMDYILFDACLMGGIEVAYELRDKCGMVGFSQAEVLAEGFDYTTLTTHLLKNKESDPQKVCEDYFERYDRQTGLYRSATISLVDCRETGTLAEVCCRLFSKYRSALASVDPSKVQRFYRYSYHWFYDLYSILAEAGANGSELEELENAISKCVKYKAATPSFITSSPTDGGFVINVYCGLSMYLPANGHAELNKYYRTLSWNKDTGLVE